MDFSECLKKRIAKEVNEDKELIISLLKTSQNKFDSEKKLDLNEVTSGSKISLLYDSLRELLEALAIKNGYKIYNHECYTYFLKEILNESVKGDEFDELRKIRNSINYYAKNISVEEAKDVLKRIDRLREEILKIVLHVKRAFIVHSWGGSPESDWYPWMKRELEKKGFKVEIPKMPNTSEPKINDWVNHLKKVVGKLDKETYFIGHSIGCQTIMRYLEKEVYTDKIANVIFVAGWFKLDNLEDKEILDDSVRFSSRISNRYSLRHCGIINENICKETEAIANPWINTPLDFNKVRQKLSKLTVFLSTNEPYGCVEENAKLFKEKLNAKVIIEKNKGHFSEDTGVTEVPEVLKEILGF